MRFSDFASRSARGSSCVRAYLGYTGMRWWETEGRRHAGMKRVKSERMGVYALFAIVVLASASGNLSQTAVNAMLGDIMLQFGLTVDLGQWLTTSYMLVLGITVPVATFLSRRFSVRQHVFIALAFFLVGAWPTCSLPTSACCWRAACSRLSPRACSCPSCRPSP